MPPGQGPPGPPALPATLLDLPAPPTWVVAGAEVRRNGTLTRHNYGVSLDRLAVSWGGGTGRFPGASWRGRGAPQRHLGGSQGGFGSPGGGWGAGEGLGGLEGGVEEVPRGVLGSQGGPGGGGRRVPLGSCRCQRGPHGGLGCPGGSGRSWGSQGGQGVPQGGPGGPWGGVGVQGSPRKGLKGVPPPRQVGNRLGVRRGPDDTMHILVDGEDMGPAATGVAKVTPP